MQFGMNINTKPRSQAKQRTVLLQLTALQPYRHLTIQRTVLLQLTAIQPYSPIALQPYSPTAL